MSATIGVGVIGATGFIGSPYREELRRVDGVKIVALCARRQQLLEEAQEVDGAQLITNQWREVVEHPDVDFVIVATPDALHHEPVIACAHAGKHVLCEKPVGKNADQAEQMWHAFRDRDLFHFVPFWTRYADIFQKAKQIVDAGSLGDIRGVIYRWHNPRPATMPLTWRDDAELSAAGSIADVGSHAYDTVCWILGQQATDVLAHADTITPSKRDLGAINLDEALGAAADQTAPARKGTTPDYASIHWQFPNGIVGTLIVSHATYFRKGLCPELELHGTDASLAINRVTGDVMIGHPEEPPKRIAVVPDEGFGNRFERFVIPALRSATNQDHEYPNLHDGWLVQRFTDAAVKSAKEGAWVPVS